MAGVKITITVILICASIYSAYLVATWLTRKRLFQSIKTLHEDVIQLIESKFLPLGFSIEPPLVLYGDILKSYARGNQHVRALYDGREGTFELSYSAKDTTIQGIQVVREDGVRKHKPCYTVRPDWKTVVERRIGKKLSPEAGREILSLCKQEIYTIERALGLGGSDFHQTSN